MARDAFEGAVEARFNFQNLNEKCLSIIDTHRWFTNCESKNDAALLLNFFIGKKLTKTPKRARR